MRIGIEAQRILRKKRHGMDMVALELIKALPQVAPENEYVVFVRPGDDESVLRDLKHVTLVYVHSLTYADWEQVWLPLAILRNKVDVMHFTSNTASLFCPVPYVLILHDVIFMENMAKSKALYQKLGTIYRQWIVPQAVRKAERVITVSNFESVTIANRFPEVSHKLSVIYNAAGNVFRFNHSSDTWSRFGNLPERFFLFLGNTDPKKNTENVIRAYVHYRLQLNGNLPLIVGDYPRALIEKTLAESGDLYLLEDIISLGYLTQTELAHLYRKATAFLYPSLRESFGIPIIEAMHCHCPVITSNTSSMPEIANDAALLIDPLKVESISLAMTKIEKSETVRSELIARGLVRANEFTWERSAENYSEIYTELKNLNEQKQLLIQSVK